MLKQAALSFVALAALAAPAAAQERAAREVEVEIALPRRADGTIDLRAIEAEVRRQLAAGATEIQFRGDFTQAEARRLLLDGRVLRELGALLPNDGIERDVRLRGSIEGRVQRTEEGGLRARIEKIDLGNMNAGQRAELARDLATQSGFERVRIRGTDANGERVRVEFRSGRGVVRNEGRADAGAARGARTERATRSERVERADRTERAERVERAERLDRSGSNTGRN